MKLRLLSGILLLSVILSACQSAAATGAAAATVKPDAATSSPAQATGSAAQYQYIFHPPSDPASAAVTLDESQAVEAVVPLEGGMLQATGADGTQYSLEIPGDALLNETKIRLIPASVSGLPFGGEQTYAAQLEPEGLFLNNYATLSITPPQDIPLDQQLFFGYQGAGQEVIFAPPVVDSKEIKIHILHFSGYGVTKGLLADPESVRERLGGSAERRIESQAAELLGRERQRQLLGGGENQDSTLAADLQALFDQYQKEVVDVRIAAAGESCAAGRLAMQTFLALERQKQLLGIGGSGMEQFPALMDTVSRVCVKEEYEMCAQDHVIHRMIPVWLGLERQMQLLGFENSSLSQYAKDMTQKCLTFDLVFESQATFDDGSGGGFDSFVNAKVPLHFNYDTLKIDGSSALINNTFTFKVPGCSVTSTRGGSTLPVSSLVFITDYHSPTDDLGYVRDFKLSYFPERTKEVFSVTCPDSPTYTSPPSGFWWSEYLVLHAGELSMEGGSSSSAPPAPAMPDLGDMMAAAQSGVNLPTFALPDLSGGQGYLLQDWEILGGEYFAKKEWTKEDADLGLVEVGTFKLYHRPGQ
jgi:hypothetical protein